LTAPADTVISLIVAMAQNGVIGRDNALPWHLREDLKRFKAHTLGKPILMGRKTFDSIGRPLPGRTNIVLTRDPQWSAPGVIAARNVEEALAHCTGSAELVAIGGAEVFRLVMPFARRFYLTNVHADVAGDTYFPAFDSTQWADVACDTYPADEHNDYAVTFMILERRSAPQAPRQH
jgi:dihydrofolate reductase